MEIRLAQEQNLIEVIYIVRECAQQLMEKGVRNWHNTQSDYADISKDISNNYVYLVSIKKVPIGTITLKPDDSDTNKTNIDRLAIFPHFQRRGYAKALIDFAIAEASKKGSTAVRGTVPCNNKSLCQLLEEKGFKNLGASGEIPNEMVKILFEKELDKSL
jgi:ribosomal protein S18 acetylase RimI-like enzyme